MSDTYSQIYIQTVFAVKNRKYYLLNKNDSLLFEKISTPFDSLLVGSGFTYYPDNDKVIYYRQDRLVVADFAKMEITLTISIPQLNGAFPIDQNTLIAFDREKNIFYRAPHLVWQHLHLPSKSGEPCSSLPFRLD
mgnify:CR=1 FL=1